MYTTWGAEVSDEDKEYEGSLPEVETTDAEKRIRDLKKTAKEKPGEVAHTLKLWLKEQTKCLIIYLVNIK